MVSEKSFSFESKKEEEPVIIIKKLSEPPAEVKQNPFYDPELWGRAKSPDDIYLPDSDEAISFAVTAHEIGHLVKEDERLDARLDNFEATRAEEQRAWDKGWPYLEKYLSEYHQDNPEIISKIRKACEQIEKLMMQGTDLSQKMYLEKGTLDGLDEEEQTRIQRERLDKFYSEKGDKMKDIFNKIKDEKIGQKLDWDRFTSLVTKAVKDILEDNKKIE